MGLSLKSFASQLYAITGPTHSTKMPMYKIKKDIVQATVPRSSGAIGG